MRPGDVVVLRSVQAGRVQQAFPHVFALEQDVRLGFYLAPGTRGLRFGRDPDGRFLERWARGDEARPHVWSDTHVLRLVAPADAHAIDLRWDESWGFLGWYVNLQSPLRQTADGFDYADWALDLEVTPAGGWRWKDEADLAEAQALGILSAETAAAARREGERVVAERLWPTGLEAWRPDPAWLLPGLVEGA